MTESSCQKQEYTFTQIPYFVMERCIHSLQPWKKWKEQLEYFLDSTHHKEFYGSDGEPFEFEWNIFPGHTTVELLKEIQKK